MKILLLTPSPPNEYNRIRLLNILKSMSKFAEITLVSLVANEHEANDLRKYSYLCKRVISISTNKIPSYMSCFLALFKNCSLRVAYCNLAKLHKTISKLTSENFDLIYIKRLRMAQYAQYFERQKVIVDATDSMALYYQRLCKLNLSILEKIVSNYESQPISKYENQIAKLYKLVVCSNKDSSYIEKSADLPRGKVEVIPNVVDLEKFQYKLPQVWSKKPKIGFFGVFSASTNEDAALWLANEIHPYLRQEFPTLESEIIGLFPPKRLLELQVAGLNIVGHTSNLCYRVNQWNAFLCPLRSGAGVKNKILQCLALGVPIIATSLSVEGLTGISADKQFLLANNLLEFAEQLVRLSNDPNLAFQISQAGRQYVEKYYSLKTLDKYMNNLCSIYSENI